MAEPHIRWRWKLLWGFLHSFFLFGSPLIFLCLLRAKPVDVFISSITMALNSFCPLAVKGFYSKALGMRHTPENELQTHVTLTIGTILSLIASLLVMYFAQMYHSEEIPVSVAEYSSNDVPITASVAIHSDASLVGHHLIRRLLQFLVPLYVLAGIIFLIFFMITAQQYKKDFIGYDKYITPAESDYFTWVWPAMINCKLSWFRIWLMLLSAFAPIFRLGI